MRIKKILNNNTVLVVRNDNMECVVLGSGIGFSRKVNDVINLEKIEKIFVLETAEKMNNFSILLKDVPIKFITTSFEIIDYAKEKYFLYLQDYIYVTLTDHLYNAYNRYIKGEYIEPLIPKIEGKYDNHYKISKKALEIFNTKFDINLPDKEVNAIALHFINSESKIITEDINENDFSENIFNIFYDVLEKLNIKRGDKNREVYDRFFIHIRYFRDRIRNQNKVINKSLDAELLEDLKVKNDEAYNIVKEIKYRLRKNLNVEIDTNEEIYLIIHIERLIEESK